MTTYEPALPNPKNLIHALRDIGYSLETAVADIIDNSISANASEVSITAKFAMENSYIAIIDNGSGMDETKLREAMHLGSFDPLMTREKNDLGRFGLGLKTASFSQSGKLTVLSRKNTETHGRCWDLNHVSETETWEIAVLDRDKFDGIPGYKFLGNAGTLVLWEDLYRLIDTETRRHPEDIFWEHIELMRQHLSLVFHRYLSGERGLNKLQITINGDRLAPFDPFEGGGKPFPEENFNHITMQAYLLPHHSKTTPEQYRKLAGPYGYTKSQGFYVYRNSRLLIHGTWFRLMRQSEATKLARVKVDLSNADDYEWSIDVKKSQAVPPEAVKLQFKRTIEKISSQAGRVYAKRGKRIKSPNYVPMWSEFHQHGKKSYRINIENPLINSFVDTLDSVQKTALKNIFGLVENGLPIDTIYADMMKEPENVQLIDVDTQLLQTAAETYWNMMKQSGLEDVTIAERLQQNEPFNKYPQFCEEFVKHKQGTGV